ncbi:hypothetical protein OsI_34864 [Oryza sativa Indica Group]|uniref:Uncharacterized protein n=1 Tax=Oryza sativa subsp. indica TaxID=39946 RepID=B8BIQ7_ORYSI|nr:hypothetical protein OsI_34864 [Oryza sativa Indica Group]
MVMEEEERSAATVVDGRGGERRRKKWRERRKKKRGGSGLRVREIEFEREGGEEEIRMGVDRVAQLGSVNCRLLAFLIYPSSSWKTAQPSS